MLRNDAANRPARGETEKASEGTEDRPRDAPGAGPGRTSRSALAGPAFAERLPAELELLEHRLEASFAWGTGADPCEPCVWHCACFMAHGA